MVTGRQILWLVDRHFRMTESDRSIYDTEHIFAGWLQERRLEGFHFDLGRRACQSEQRCEARRQHSGDSVSQTNQKVEAHGGRRCSLRPTPARTTRPLLQVLAPLRQRHDRT